MARKEPTGLAFIDEMNPRLFSNNLLLPYLVAIWEDYFKSTFSAVLKYSANRSAALKNARLPQEKLESIAGDTQTVENAIAESLSFQRPKIVSTNFKLVDSKFDLASAMRKPFRRRKLNLFDTIDAYVDSRNEFVHSGTMDLTFTDAKLAKAIEDFDVAVDRCYSAICNNFGFAAIRDY